MVGEFSYIVLLRRHLQIPVSEGIRSLFEARLFDLQFVIVGGPFGLLGMGQPIYRLRVDHFSPRRGLDYSESRSFQCAPQRYRNQYGPASSGYILGVIRLYWTPSVIN